MRVFVLAVLALVGYASADRPHRAPAITPVSSEAERQRACDQYWAYTLSFPDLASAVCPR